MSMYEKEWECCGDVTITKSWQPEKCPFCTAPPSKPEKNLDVGIDVTEFGTQLVIRRGNEIIKSEFYKAPSKPWVSLTDDEMGELYDKTIIADIKDYAKAIEAKLKELNT